MGSEKGGSFERDTCRLLSLWWTEVIENKGRDDVFWRTSGSGARATTHQKKGKTLSSGQGDVMAIDEVGKPFEHFFITELKRGYTKDLILMDIMDSKNKHPSILLQWWYKAESERVSASRKASLVIFQRDRKKRLAVVSRETYQLFQTHCGNMKINPMMTVSIGKDNLVIIQLEDFLEWVSPNSIVALSAP